jgi:hypothetical protein
VVGDVVDEGEVLVHRPRAAPELQHPLLLLRSSVAVIAVDGEGGPRACHGVGGRRAAPATMCRRHVVDWFSTRACTW